MAIITGTDKGETLLGTPDADTIDGKGGNDIIRAQGGADILTGGTGNDEMHGGTGNDIYYVDSAGDSSIELENQGIDEVRTQTQNYFLDNNVENMTVLYKGDFGGSGNQLDNVIRGGAGNDNLNGNGGIDTILGNGGDDEIIGHGLLRGGRGRDWVMGSEESDDWLYGDSGDDRLETGGGNDRAYGGDGNDLIIGDFNSLTFDGNDRLYGEAGDDWIIAGGGNDIARGGADDDKIEGEEGDDQLFGEAGDDTLSDDSGNNKLYGGDGNDTLIGTGGNNIMYGGKGADDYLVDNLLDRVVENGREGTDDVATTLNFYALGPNVENLRFAGEGHFFGTGTALNNIIVGGDGNDVLKGGAGNDTLIGAVGLDTAVFAGKSTDYAVSTVDGITTVTDLNAADGNDGKDRLNGIELLQFADKTIALPEGPQVEMGLGGLTLFGANYGDHAGNAIIAGDINGDGTDDLVIGAPGFDPDGNENPDNVEASAGAAYVVFAEPDVWPMSANLRDLSKGGDITGEINGFRLDGIGVGQAAVGTISAGDQVGRTLAAAGDVNGDGFADFIVGAPTAASTTYEAGEAYVIFGKAGGWPTTQDIVDLDGINGFRIPGTKFGQRLATDVASAGDINGDGFDDVIVTDGSVAYVVFGHDAPWSAVFDLSAIDGTNGFRIEGVGAVSDAGDVNGDGIGDVIVEETGGPNSYVVYGKLGAWDAGHALAEIDGTTVVTGALAVIGDINGDGFDDLAASDPSADPHGIIDAGSTYVIFGGEALVDTNVDLAALDGTNGFRVDGSHLNGGSAPVAAGDVNGDGNADFMINAGPATYVIYGKEDGWDADIELAEINGINGFRIASDGATGQSAGDVNADGFDDLIFGRAGPSPADPGTTIVFFGGDFTGSAALSATDLLDIGGPAEDAIASGGGDGARAIGAEAYRYHSTGQTDLPVQADVPVV